jgi:hypothetical protein
MTQPDMELASAYFPAAPSTRGRLDLMPSLSYPAANLVLELIWAGVTDNQYVAGGSRNLSARVVTLRFDVEHGQRDSERCPSDLLANTGARCPAIDDESIGLGKHMARVPREHF